MSEIELTVDGQPVHAMEGMTVFQAAAQAGVDIPHLCYDPRVDAIGACRMCVVRIEGRAGLTVSCDTLAEAGMSVVTEDDEIASTRRTIIELILSEHCVECPTCDRDGACKLQDYAYRYSAREQRFGVIERRPPQPL